MEGPHPRIPVFRTLEELRSWRGRAREMGMEVGVVPTMGALHEGHLNLVRTSMQRHPLTVMTLFVNPMQFAPTEDLSSYPRTLARDLELLSTLLPPSTSSSTSTSSSPTPNHSEEGNGPTSPTVPSPHFPLVVFNPREDVMYPLKGDLQDLSRKRGVEVDVKGWGDVMEGASRPQFFKGVATVCTKLFNAVEPDHAYFGQKDIQQALLLKIMLSDLLISHPLPENMHILPTTRDPVTHLALSSRNAYLSIAELEVAAVLYRALSSAKALLYDESRSSDLASTENQPQARVTGEDMIATATRVILDEQERIAGRGPGVDASVELKLDYFEVFDNHTFEPVRGVIQPGREMVIAGAVWVGKTRLIDNLLLGWEVD